MSQVTPPWLPVAEVRCLGWATGNRRRAERDERCAMGGADGRECAAGRRRWLRRGRIWREKMATGRGGFVAVVCAEFPGSKPRHLASASPWALVKCVTEGMESSSDFSPSGWGWADGGPDELKLGSTFQGQPWVDEAPAQAAGVK